MFLGCGTSENGDCFLVTEFMDGGSLDRVLWGGSDLTTVSTSWMQRIHILIDVVDGLAYLHLMHKSVHRDLKSPNILLEWITLNDDAARSDRTVTHRAKIADFGLSKIFLKGKKRISTTKETKKSSKSAIIAANWKGLKQKGFVGTPRWMAPEMMKSEVKIGPSADIYSFGVIMWEVWTRRKPWREFSDKQDIFKAVRDEKRTLPVLQKTEDEEAVPIGYVDLLKRCCEYKANRRPLIDVVHGDLQNLLEKAAEIDRDVQMTMMDSPGQGDDDGNAAQIEMGHMMNVKTMLESKSFEHVDDDGAFDRRTLGL
ncbi:protein kinase [bacterium]|nr:protein kinase [bacterium]